MSEKIELILILKKVNQPQFIEEKEKTEIQSLILLNLPLLRNFQNPIIKIKDAFFIDIFKKFEKFIPEFCSGDKIILPKENYNEFISDIFHNFFDSSNNIFNFEYDLDFIISLVYILLENNILDLYYRLFLVDCKEKFENKGDRDIQTNFSSSISLFERTNFCKVWFNVGKYSKIELKSFEKKEEKIEEINIIKDKEDFIIESLFESMEKKKNDNYNKNENDKKQLETSQTPHFEFITPNNCKLMNDLTGNNLNHFYYPFIQNPNSSKEENYKQKLAPIEIKKKKGKLPESSQKNTNNSHRIKGKKPF